MKTVEVKMRGIIAVNDAEAYLSCGLKGVDIIQVPRFTALPHLRAGELVEVLPQWNPLPIPISAVYPHNRHLSPKVRVFVDWAAELFERCLPTSTASLAIVRHGTPEVAGTEDIVA